MAKAKKKTEMEPQPQGKGASAKGQAAFTRKQLLAFKRYQGRGDLLSTLLADGRTYTMKEVDSIMNKFLKGQVN